MNIKKITLITFIITIISVNYIFSQNIEVVSGTFLGNEKRNFYGENAPSKLKVKWKLYLGKGITTISRKIGDKLWYGAGWTGQPLVVKENNKTFLIQGAYDHNLKKIDAKTGKIVWQSKFDDVLKGTGTIWYNKNAKEEKNKLVILQGSRLGQGNYLDNKIIPSYRGVSYKTGEQLWIMNVKWGASYSRDVDGSALIIKDTAYIGLENALFTVFDPNYKNGIKRDGLLQPKIFEEHKLYEKSDRKLHKGNLVTESSPCRLRDHIYIASGSGHVYGYNLNTRKIDWEFFIGSDIDGSPVVTNDSCILVSIEKQYIKGRGGVLKLDPTQKGKAAVKWFFPVKDKKFHTWDGGIIGTASVDDYYTENTDNNIAAFSAIDGYLYIIKHKKTTEKKELAFDNINSYITPELLYKYKIGPSISTPIIVGNKIIAASYNAIFLFERNGDTIKLLDRFPGSFESSPVVYNNKVFIASRNGYMYCLGE